MSDFAAEEEAGGRSGPEEEVLFGTVSGAGRPAGASDETGTAVEYHFPVEIEIVASAPERTDATTKEAINSIVSALRGV
jgi:hypothetical protein